MNRLKDFSWLVAALIFVVACHMARTVNSNPSTANKTLTFDTQGHRGCRGLMPENTVPAMKTALGLGVTTLEMDVVITKDKQVVVSHDPFLTTTSPRNQTVVLLTRKTSAITTSTR
jgi:glycerophosphoryl diester phosphodiesterase